ncbi:MAG: hypothetical protein C4K48_06505 [Candidatus Thorarchaeota archaeon]|nr:MAG: hypothetical protein C4K48_06505 [Candidatus Thorarchaeota archaeon]
MRKNVVSYVGLLGFIGLLGLPTGNYGFYGFFGFFGFFGALEGRGSDERVDQNVNRACRNSFFLYIVVMAFSLTCIVALRAIDILPLAFALLFVGSMVTFVLSYIFYDRRGD